MSLVNMKIRSKNIAAIAIAAAMALSGLSLYLNPGPIFPQSLEEELEQIKQDRKETQEKIEQIKRTESQYRGEVSKVEEQLLAALTELDGFHNKLSEAKTEVDKTTIELVLKEEDLNKIEEELDIKVAILNNRIEAIYKNGTNNILELLLKAEDFIDFISRMKLMNLFAEQDTQNVLIVKNKRSATIGIKKSIVDLREKQKEYKENIEKFVAKAEQKSNEVEGIYDNKKSLLNQTTANKNALLRMEKELEIQEAEVSRILESYKYGTAPSGKFMWPVAGRFRSGFGYRIHPIFGTRRFHSGLDLSAPHGTLVKAGDGAQVIQAGYYGGYGYAITLYHGGGFATLYAHLSNIRVTPGQFVERGQVIGLVGSTGLSTGPHLHFEVRINGGAQNPLAYLE